MNYSKTILYFLLVGTHIIIGMDHPSWTLVRSLNDAENINAAYFDRKGTRLITCSKQKAYILYLDSKTELFLGLWEPTVLSFGTTENLLAYSFPNNITGYVPFSKDLASSYDILKNSMLQGSVGLSTNSSGSFASDLTIAPHRFGPPTLDNKEGFVARKYLDKLYLFDLANRADAWELDINCIDCSFHPFKQAIAAIQGNYLSVIELDPKSEEISQTGLFFTSILHSVRYDETGNRLVVTNEKTIDILDMANVKQGASFKMTSIPNTENCTQACLAGKFIALALKACIKLFDLEKDRYVAEYPSNEMKSPMNCFDAEGKHFVRFKDNQAFVYKKTE